MTSRKLTHDQRKAAEAAFRGLPPDPSWSEAAQAVYDGIVKVLPGAQGPMLAGLAGTDEDDAALVSAEPKSVQPGQRKADPGRPWRAPGEGEVVQAQSGSRDQAIEAGILIDITPQAREMGLPLPVGVSRSLWEYGIAATDRIPEQDQEQRVRDLLLALRLHLSRVALVSPVTQFPALFSFPPEPVPQICGVCAVVQAETPDDPFLTLVLPTELSVPNQPS